MRIKITVNKLISLLKVCIFIFLASAAFNVYAEYYLVYAVPPESNFVCIHCHRYHHHHRHPHYGLAVHHRHHPVLSTHHRRSSYHISIYYPVYPACGCADVWVACSYPTRSSDEVYSAKPDRYGERYYDEDTNYDPDMTTGDDDPTADPNLDIDH